MKRFLRLQLLAASDHSLVKDPKNMTMHEELSLREQNVEWMFSESGIRFGFPQIARPRYFTHGLGTGIVVPLRERRFRVSCPGREDTIMFEETGEAETNWSEHPPIRDEKVSGIEFFGRPRPQLMPSLEGRLALKLLSVFVANCETVHIWITLNDDGYPGAAFMHLR